MENFPDELLLYIFEILLVDDSLAPQPSGLLHRPLLPLQGDRQWSWALCHVNRRFHRIIKTLLYRTYRFSIGHPELFLRTLSTSPGLGSCVKSLTWGFGDDGRILQSDLLSLPEKVHIATCLRQLQTTSAQRLADRFTELTCADEDAYLSAILLFTPHIEELFIDGTNHWPTNQTWLKLAMANPHALSRLSKITIRGYPRPKSMWSILTLSSLKIFEVTLTCEKHTDYVERRPQFAEWDKGDQLHRPFRSEQSNVECFNLAGEYGSTLPLMSLAKSFRRLKKFGVAWISSPGQSRFKAYDALIRLCNDHRESLESVRFRDQAQRSFENYHDLLHCFSGLQKLRALDVDFISFLPLKEYLPNRRYKAPVPRTVVCSRLESILQCLPKGIDDLSLCVNDPENFMGGHIDGCIETFLAMAPIFPMLQPALSKLSIVDWNPLLFPFPCQTQLSVMQKAFSQANIAFTAQTQEEGAHDGDVFCLDYVEKDWVWIQVVDLTDMLWKYVMCHDHLGPFDLHDVNCWQLREDWDECEDWGEHENWEMVDVVDYRGDVIAASSDHIVMDQYLSEQPVWYWEQLCNKYSLGDAGIAESYNCI